jgi:anti-sigma-K factor RskA
VSQTSNRSGHERWEGDTAAYALGALEQHELRAFEQHLAGCPQCQRELAVMRRAVDSLSMAAPSVVPDAELKQRVMSRIREESVRQPAPADPLASPRQRRRAPRIPWRRLTPVLAATAAIVVALAVLALSLGGGSSTRTYGAVVNAPGATASVRVSGGHARLLFARLPRLPSRLIYEMWLKRGAATPVPAGALFASSSGAVEVPGGVRGVQAVLVTAEPRPSGTRKPTRAPIIVVRLT